MQFSAWMFLWRPKEKKRLDGASKANCGTKCRSQHSMREFLFELPPESPKKAERLFRQLPRPIWTESKANLIERYLNYFVMVTHHGTYLDAFAGPQRTDNHEIWSAKLVIESRPR